MKEKQRKRTKTNMKENEHEGKRTLNEHYGTERNGTERKVGTGQNFHSLQCLSVFN